MRVCLLSSSFPRFEGDFPGVFVYELGRHLVAHGAEVVALAPHAYELPRRENLGGIQVYRYPYFFPRSLQRLCYGAGISVNVKHSRLARMQIPLFGISQLLALLWAKRQLRIDVVNAHWLVPQGLNAALVRKGAGLPNVCTVHAAGLFALRRMPFGAQIARFIKRHTDHVFAVSSYIGDVLQSLTGRDADIEVLPMGIGLDRFACQRADTHRDTHNVLFVGRLVEKKGVGFLLDAMPEVFGRYPQATLTLVGDGPLREELAEQVEAASIGPNVEFLGIKRPEDMPAIYANADLVVVPSIVDRSGETEGMPVVVLEALAAGRPVVASDVSGISDLIEDGINGFLVEPESSSSLAAGVLRALGRLRVDTGLQHRAYLSAKPYDWQRVSRRYLDVFHRVASHAGRESSDDP